MRQSNHFLPISGPNSDPVLHGIAQGLADLFPPIELSLSHDETDEQIEEDDFLE